MTDSERRALVRRLQAGKRKKKREAPKRARAIERKMNALGKEFKRATAERRIEIIHELRPLGVKLSDEKWSH